MIDNTYILPQNYNSMISRTKSSNAQEFLCIIKNLCYKKHLVLARKVGSLNTQNTETVMPRINKTLSKKFSQKTDIAVVVAARKHNLERGGFGLDNVSNGEIKILEQRGNLFHIKLREHHYTVDITAGAEKLSLREPVDEIINDTRPLTNLATVT